MTVEGFQQGPPMSVKFALRVEKDAVVMVRGSGTRQREERIMLDGTTLEEPGSKSMTLRTGEWIDGKLEYVVESYRMSDDERTVYIRRVFHKTPDGLEIRVSSDPDKQGVLAFYRHPDDIPQPKPAKAKITDMDWLAGAWVNGSDSSSGEERWSPPKGGSMLGISRTVKNNRMTSFEYLRVVERNGGLVYVAQPGGRTATEFVCTELSATRAVFDNPRHDYPQRITYELSGDSLSATIGFIRGGRGTRFGFERE